MATKRYGTFPGVQKIVRNRGQTERPFTVSCFINLGDRLGPDMCIYATEALQYLIYSLGKKTLSHLQLVGFLRSESLIALLSDFLPEKGIREYMYYILYYSLYIYRHLWQRVVDTHQTK